MKITKEIKVHERRTYVVQLKILIKIGYIVRVPEITCLITGFMTEKI